MNELNRGDAMGGGKPALGASGWETPPGQLSFFLVERRLPVISRSGLAMLHAALVEATGRFADRGDLVLYLRSTFVPRQGRLLSIFASGTLDVVRAVNEAALAPFISIEAVVDLPRPGNSN